MGDGRHNPTDGHDQEGSKQPSGSSKFFTEMYIEPNLDGAKIQARGADLDKTLKDVGEQISKAAGAMGPNGELTPAARTEWEKAIAAADAANGPKFQKELGDLQADLQTDETVGASARAALYDEVQQQWKALPDDRKERILELQWLQDEAKTPQKKEQIQQSIDQLEPKGMPKEQKELSDLTVQSYNLQKVQVPSADLIIAAPVMLRLKYANLLYEHATERLEADPIAQNRELDDCRKQVEDVLKLDPQNETAQAMKATLDKRFKTI